MIEINGWVSIHISPDGEGDLETLKKTIQEITHLIEPLVSFNQFFKIEPLNGTYILFIGLNHNHDNGYYDLILKLLDEVGTRASGSYGIVYVRDHDNSSDFNKFKILKIVRGTVTVEDDKFISPCNPIIEDGF